MSSPGILRRIAASVAAVAIIGTSAATSAQALTPFEICGLSKVMCGYADAGYKNVMGVIAQGTGLTNIAASKNDTLSSLVNTSYTYEGAWYENSNGGGKCYGIIKRGYTSYAFLDGKNDTMSSWRLNRAC